MTLPAWGAGDKPAMAPAAPRDPTSLLRALDDGFVAVFEKVAPAVVVIENTKSSRSESDSSANEAYDFFFRSPDDDSSSRRSFRMPEPSNRSEGSGLILREDGIIATNNHVIEGAEKLTVRLKDGRKFTAKVLGTDAQTDLAVIKIEAKGLPVANLADSETVRVGQLVCAIGVPFKLDYSFSIGCVSGKGRTDLSNLTYEDYIQTDSLINPGNSGGPLFDVEGNVIGMNTLINGIGRGLAFAIPSNMIKEVTGQLIATGKIRRPALGIRIETLRDDSSLREQIQGIDKGVVVNTIEPDTAAYRSDLRPADVITSVDGVPVETARELQKQVLSKKIGQTISLSVWRSGKTLTIPVTAGELPSMGTAAAREPLQEETEGESGAPIHGLLLENVTRKTADRLKLKEKSGALVTAVTPNSPAAAASLQVDDVITEIDSKPVTGAAAAQKLFTGRDNKKAFLLMVERNGQKTYALLKIEK